MVINNDAFNLRLQVRCDNYSLTEMGDDVHYYHKRQLDVVVKVVGATLPEANITTEWSNFEHI